MKNFNLIFDLDGTLWDSTNSVLSAWNEVLAKENKELIDACVLEKCFGKTFDEINEIVFGNSVEGKRILEDCMNNELTHIKKIGGILYKNTLETLAELKKYNNLYIVSNCQKGYIEAFIKYFNLESIFIDFECEGNTKKNKTHNIKILMERNNLNPTNTIYIGDTSGDMLSAKNNHLPFIYAKYGFGNITNCDYAEIDDISDLLVM